ncbi:predicted protein [Histoplasma mississippiense (nom. inval.)]|uniref:predicted protein n=1 Tax=Ajellomyces capsulatus (strain NAm1 / WU24) TaxID=2059318 RepID=UPI000157C24A|nr:predicted protein [Histoplasma mississippiense (nom. inval.)]EDN07620.1 predicted protein [Histoplasma mississippiense (nom. inval.)]
MPEQRRNPSAEVNSYPDVPQQYWSSQSNAPASSSLAAPQPTHSVNRLGSTASTSTTKANRGSPPPPETPIVPPGRSDIESRYAAAGIAGTSTLTNLQAQSAAAQQRAQQYAAPQTQTHLSQPQNSTPRPWTPTELPGSQPHGPPTVYQGPVPTSVPPPQTSGPASHPPPGHPAGYHQNHNPLEEDFQRMNLTASPPPAYSSLGGPGPGGSAPHSYPNEKQGAVAIAGAHPASMIAMSTAAMTPSTLAPHSHTHAPSTQGHPAFANDPRQADPRTSQPNTQNGQPGVQPTPLNGSPAPPGPSPASPPPLPEGWIAHLDPNSGQYYYIHLPSQSTQWEFPKGRLLST